MSLWEYGAIMHGWSDRQPKPEGLTPLDPDAAPDADAWAEARIAAARVVRSAQKGDKA